MTTDFLPEGRLILCAVSGGADSVYLLCRLHQLGYPVAAAHYNHGLRGEEADRDEAFVRTLCEREDIPFLAEKGDVNASRLQGESTEEAARRLRYDFLERAAQTLGAAVIATAHNADDNAETVLLNMTRGAGLHGLCGIPPVRGRIVRPMLDVTRAEVEQWLARNGISHIEDSTNAQDGYTRNRLRHNVMPALRRENPQFSRAVGRMTAFLREDEQCLCDLAADFICTHVSEEGAVLPVDELLALPKAISSRVIRQMCGDALSAAQTDAVYSVLTSGGEADVPGMRVLVSCGKARFGGPDCVELPDRNVFSASEIILPECGLLLRCERLSVCPAFVYSPFTNFYLRCEKIYGAVTVGARMPGDALRRVNRNETKTLHRLFIDEKVPAWRRGLVPVLRDGSGVLAVYGFGADERAAAREGDTDIFHIEFSRLRPEEEEQ